MTQSKYAKMNMNALRQAARKAGIDAKADWKKTDFAAALEAHERENRSAEEMSDLPPPTQAPDESDASSGYQPPTAPPAVPAPPPPPPKPGEDSDIPPDKMPPQAKWYILMTDKFKWVNERGMPIEFKKGRRMSDKQYPIEEMKKRGAVFVREHVLDARKAAKE